MSELPAEMNDDLRAILGRPCFACGQLAELMRKNGMEIRTRAEDEQAAVIFWLLKIYLEFKEGWQPEAARQLNHHRGRNQRLFRL